MKPVGSLIASGVGEYLMAAISAATRVECRRAKRIRKA
jgi:hypothetical protein